MLVKAAPGIRVPCEHDLRECITDAQAVEIEMTGYYIRRMSDGDLVEVEAEIARPAETSLDVPVDVPNNALAPAPDEPRTSAAKARKA